MTPVELRLPADERPAGARWPVRVPLRPAQRQRIAAIALRCRPRCPACGAVGVEVGDATFVGYLVHRAEPHTWTVEVTCRNRRCSRPTAVIALPAANFP
jgi:hypothetical protein